MRFVAIAVLGFAALGLGGCQTAAFASYAAAHPVPRDHISVAVAGHRQWNQLNNLTPVPLAIGQSRAEAEAALLKAGYGRGGSDRWRLSDDQKPLVARADIWTLDYRGLPCNIIYQVFVEFDASDRLVSAWGRILEAGCL